MERKENDTHNESKMVSSGFHFYNKIFHVLDSRVYEA